MKYTTISSKRQLTLSKEQLDKLGLTINSKVTVNYEKGALVIRPLIKTIVDETAGVFKNVLPESKYAQGTEILKKDVRNKVSQKISTIR